MSNFSFRCEDFAMARLSRLDFVCLFVKCVVRGSLFFKSNIVLAHMKSFEAFTDESF